MLEFCKYQVSNFLIQPANHYIIDYAPKSYSMDISERVKLGVEMARKDGIDLVFIIEDDDKYDMTYIDMFGDLTGIDFAGVNQTIYYHIKNRTWQIFSHPQRASLFQTAFRVSAMSKFRWPENTPFIDIEIWKYASNFKTKFILNSGSIGIKGHGIGITGGKGHQIKFNKKDPNFDYLKEHVSEEAFKFYMSL
jgi:hypothetical protein